MDCWRSMNNIIKYFFSQELGLSAEQADYLACLFSKSCLPKGKLVVGEGERWNKAMFIDSGLLRFFYSTGEGKEYNKGFFFDQDFIWPVTPSAQSEPSLFSIETLSSTVVYMSDFHELRSHLKVLGAWEAFALPYVEKLVEQKFKREYDFLVLDAQTRFYQLTQRFGERIDKIPDYHLASYLGITNVALSRIRKRLTAQDVWLTN